MLPLVELYAYQDSVEFPVYASWTCYYNYVIKLNFMQSDEMCLMMGLLCKLS